MAVGEDFPDVLMAAQSGADHAIGQLFAAHNPELVRYLDGRARGFGDDLAQEVWIAAARNLRSFTGDEQAFRAWLFSIARSKLIDHGRRLTRQPASATDPHIMEDTTRAEVPLDALTSNEAIAELVEGLSDQQADIVLLRVVGGFSVDEVAAIIGKRAGAVRVAQHRALRRVAQRLEEQGVTR
ncbi:MAG: RNA polymerase sigma factor [Acidimicrobiales bacterium]